MIFALNDRLNFIMGLPIPLRPGLHIDTGPKSRVHAILRVHNIDVALSIHRRNGVFTQVYICVHTTFRRV